MLAEFLNFLDQGNNAVTAGKRAAEAAEKSVKQMKPGTAYLGVPLAVALLTVAFVAVARNKQKGPDQQK